MVNKSTHAVSLLLEMARRFYDSRMERAQMRFAPTRCPDVLPPVRSGGIIRTD